MSGEPDYEVERLSQHLLWQLHYDVMQKCILGTPSVSDREWMERLTHEMIVRQNAE